MLGAAVRRPIRLDRPLLSRLRLTGAIEFLSLPFLTVPFLIAWEYIAGEDVSWGGAGGVVVVVVAVVMPLIVRVAVWTEYLEVDGEEIRWRSLFRASRYLWKSVESIDVAYMGLFPSKSGLPVLRVRFVNGLSRKLRCTVDCDRTWPAWLAAVQAQASSDP